MRQVLSKCKAEAGDDADKANEGVDIDLRLRSSELGKVLLNISSKRWIIFGAFIVPSLIVPAIDEIRTRKSGQTDLESPRFPAWVRK